MLFIYRSKVTCTPISTCKLRPAFCTIYRVHAAETTGRKIQIIVMLPSESTKWCSKWCSILYFVTGNHQMMFKLQLNYRNQKNPPIPALFISTTT